MSEKSVDQITEKEWQEYYPELNKLSIKERNILKYKLRFIDGRDYADYCDPENLDETLLNDITFLKGYNSRRSELGKLEIPLPNKRNSK